jgi:hypothetical protein
MIVQHQLHLTRVTGDLPGDVRAALSFCLAFHPSSLPLPDPLFGFACTSNLPSFSLHAFLATLHFIRSQLSFPYSHSLSLARSLTPAHWPISTRGLTAHILCHPFVSSFSLSLCQTTTRLRRLVSDACGYQSLPDHNTPVRTDVGVQVCVEHSISRFSNHTVAASWHWDNPSTLHAASHLTIICCVRVTCDFGAFH